MDRRDFLKFSLALSATVSWQAMAATSTAGAPRFLLVFLRGAYDANSLLVPASSQLYYQSRPTLAIPKASLLSVNTDWGLHPLLRDNLYPLFTKGQLAFIPFSGTDDVSRSHFKTQDSVELGQALDGPKDYKSGFMNRLADIIGPRKSIAFTKDVPLVFRGKASIPNLPLKNGTTPVAFASAESDLIMQMYAGTPLDDRVKEGFTVRDEASLSMAGEPEEAARGAISTRGFEAEAGRIGKLMREQYQLGFVDVGGWDTHVNQGAIEGTLPKKLSEVARGLKVFADEMGPAWKNTVVMVISEFGRTFRENGNKGTDHGHGTTYWMLGGSISGGKIAGEQLKLEADTLFQGRDTPILNNYRDTLAGLFKTMYGLNQAQLEAVFPGKLVPNIHGIV
ncbi:DUF1501 domain-containing protein [Methylobacillus flagellatus]|uniref:DUF1501 domain-containing protein n=1 Tax=Methylobacillus flagellatus TaxID=405 RepID=UPI0010F7763F|nr:DUF1501 domain-containing protein [Methylobacillus flagellatus]